MDRFVVQDPEWRVQANCATTDPEAMFPERHQRRQVALAKKVCAECVVVSDCLADALNTGDVRFGIRGELEPHERAKLQ